MLKKLVLFDKSAVKQCQFPDLLFQVRNLRIQPRYLRILHPLHSLQTSTRSEHGIGSSREKRRLVPLSYCLHQRLQYWRVDRREHTRIEWRRCVFPRRWRVILGLRYPVTYCFHSHHSINTPLLMYFMRLSLHRIPSFALFLKVNSRLAINVSYRLVFEFEICQQIHFMLDYLLSLHLIPCALWHQTQRCNSGQVKLWR